jgi:AraC family L-rhamnose operon regulatory protein RhaS
MGRRIPIYTSQQQVRQADSCQPLVQAVEAGELRMETLAHGHYPGRRLPRHALSEVKTLGFWDADQPQSWGLGWHQNEGIELCLLERGTLQFAIEGESWQLKPNDLTVTRPWQRHRLGAPNIGPGRLHWLILDLGVRRPHQVWHWPSWILLSPSDLDELTSILRHNEHPVWHNATQVCECFVRIAHAVQTDRDGSNVSWLTVLINELLLHTLDLFRRHDVTLDESLSDSLRTVELFVEDLHAEHEQLAEEWTLGRMAEACGLGVTRFTDCFRRLTNATPMHYLNRLRLQMAAELLVQQPAPSNTELAKQCGFSSPQYFATVFRRHFGCTPQQFSAEQRDNSLRSNATTGDR